MNGILIAICFLGFEGPDAKWVPVDTLDARASLHMEGAPVGKVFPGAKAGAWEFLGPMPDTGAYWSLGPVSGRTVFVLNHPTDPDIAYIAAAQGGVWKTTDRGNTWQVLTDALTSLASGALAFDPGDPQVIYYGTGEMHFAIDCKNGDGLFKSTDGGATWTKIATAQDAGNYISKVIVNPANPDIIMVARDYGVARSTDGGSTWTRPLSINYANDLVIKPGDASTYYAGIRGQGIYISTDTGETWTMLAGGLPSPSEPFARIQLAISESDPQVLYAAFTSTQSGNGGGLYGLYKTTDGGTTWTQLTNTPNYLYPQGWYDNAIIVDPSDPNTVYAGGVFPYGSGYYGIVKTTDGGATWTDISDQGANGKVHPDIHSFGFDANGDLWVTCDGGVWRTTDGGDSWINLNWGLGTIQFYGLALHPTDTSVMQGGTQDNGTPRREGSVVWYELQSGDGGPALFETDATPSVDTSFATFQAFSGPYRYVNGVYNRDTHGPWVDQGDRTSWGSAAFITDPTDPSVLLAGSYRMWESPNSGASWSSISGDLTRGSGVLLCADVYPGDPNIIYVGSSDGVLSLTTDRGASWLDRTPTVSYLPINAIKVNPHDPDEVYAVYSFMVYHTTDGGQSWDNIGTYFGGNNILLRAGEVDFSFSPPMVMVGGERGVFYTVDNGATWDSLGTGLPWCEVYDMEALPSFGVLVVATHGRGMWRLANYSDVAEAAPGVHRVGLRWLAPGKLAYDLPPGTWSMTVYDISGRAVLRKSLAGQGEFVLPEVAPGVYIAKAGPWSASFAITR